MIWFGVLVTITVLVAVVVLAGAGPRGARRVAHTRLLAGARVVLVVLVAAVAWVLWRQ